MAIFFPPFPSKTDTIRTVSVAHTLHLPNLSRLPPPNGASQQQPLAILLVLLAVRGTLPNTQAWGPLLSEGGEESHRGRCPGTRNGWSLGDKIQGNKGLCGPGAAVISSLPGSA